MFYFDWAENQKTPIFSRRSVKSCELKLSAPAACRGFARKVKKCAAAHGRRRSEPVGTKLNLFDVKPQQLQLLECFPSRGEEKKKTN